MPSEVIVASIRVRGIVDADHVAPLRRELDRAIDAGANRLLVDLSDMREVTTAAINALLAARQRLIATGGRVSVVLPGRLRHRFEVLQLNRRFLLASNVQEATRLIGIGSQPDELHARAS